MKERPFANPYLRAGGGGFVDNSSHSDDEYDPRGRALSKDRNGRRAMQNSAAKAQVGRSRPTNNQLLYKAYFRWAHYPFKIKNNGVVLPTETDACPSVTAAFLQVLHTLHAAEISRVGPRRNVLQILSTNTKKTKVVELSTGTHRVPDELKKHYLSDGEAGQYSTNLDRNRYGNDDQYLFTVVRYDLEFLGLCPCMVDVEIIDAKNDNQSIFVSAGPEACACHKQEGGWAAADPTPYTTMQHMQRHQPHGGSGKALGPGAVQDSPKRSASAFDALLMAATGGTDGAAAGAEPAGEPPVTSKFGADVSGPAAAPAPAPAPALAAAPASTLAAVPAAAAAAAPAAAPAAVPAVERERRAHALPAKQRSRLWSGMSYGDVDSLQNALDAFRAEEEIASEGGGSEVLVPEIGSFRKRARKPIKPSNSFLSLDNSLLGAGGAQQYKGLKEKSDENGAGKGDVISSGNAATTRPRRTRGGEGEGEQEVSQNTDSRAAEHGPEDTAAGGPGVVAEATPVDPDEALPVAQRRVRHVPRQSSAANLGARVQPADIKRMAAELDTLRQDNKRLRLQLELASGSSGAGPGGSPLGGRNVADLERRCRQLEMELRQSSEQRRTLEQKVQDLTNDLHTTRTAANQLVTKFLMEQHQQAPQHPPGPMPPALDPAAAAAGYGGYGPGPGGFPMDRLGLAGFGSGPAGASAAAGSYPDPRSSGSYPDPRASGPGGVMDYKPKGYDSDLGREPGNKRVKMEPSNGIAELLAAAAAAREGLPGV